MAESNQEQNIILTDLGLKESDELNVVMSDEELKETDLKSQEERMRELTNLSTEQLRDDCIKFIYDSTQVKIGLFEQKRFDAIVNTLKFLEIEPIDPKRVTDILLSKMVDNGELSKDKYDKFWELMKPHNEKAANACKPYIDIRNEAFNKLMSASMLEMSAIEEEFMQKFKAIIKNEMETYRKFIQECHDLMKDTEVHECPYCAATKTLPNSTNLPNLPNPSNSANLPNRSIVTPDPPTETN